MDRNLMFLVSYEINVNGKMDKYNQYYMVTSTGLTVQFLLMFLKKQEFAFVSKNDVALGGCFLSYIFIHVK